MSSLEAKIVVLGSQGVGKTSLVIRYCKGAFNPSQITSTVGASFTTKRVVDTDTDSIVRLQIWDTAGQERYRSISPLYYRGANACILCYSITDAQSFAEMGMWLTELRHNLPADIVLHVVGTKADVVARDPSRREVPFERCIAYVAENLTPGIGSTPPPTASAPMGGIPGFYRHPHHPHGESTAAGHDSAGGPAAGSGGGGGGGGGGVGGISSSQPQSTEPRSPSSKRSSGFWFGQDVGWDACHEVSAESGEGVDEVFRVVTRKLVEQNRKMQQALLAATATPGGMLLHRPGAHMAGAGGVSMAGAGDYPGGMMTSAGGILMLGDGSAAAVGMGMGMGSPGVGGGPGGYFDANPRGSFRVGRDRRSWLFSPSYSSAVPIDQAGAAGDQVNDRRTGLGKCC